MHIIAALLTAALPNITVPHAPRPTDPGNPAPLIADVVTPPAQATLPQLSGPEAPSLCIAVKEVSRECWCLLQAKNGDYWFGSEEHGVFRSNGAAIINYTKADGLPSNRVRAIQEDKNGNIYFTTPSGISKYDGRTFTTLTPVDPPDRDNGGGWRLHPDDLWFAWGEGVCRYDGTTLYDLKMPTSYLEEAFRKEQPHASYDPYDIFSIHRDSRGHIWLGTSNFGVCRYDGTSFGWLYEDHLVFAPNGGLFGLRSVIEDRDGAYWICNTKHRFRIEPESKDGKLVYTREPGIDPRLTHGEVIYFQGAVADAAGDLWLSPWGGGIWRWDGKHARNYPVKDNGAHTHVITIFKDNAGTPWLATQTAGPYRFDDDSFEPFKP